MKIGPRYKIARRLGAAVFDKTLTPKFQLRLARKTKFFARPKSEFGIQLMEKQKARFTYGVNERQFARYVKNAIAQKKMKASDELFKILESRLDNIVYRLGLAQSRSAARQMVSHGHILVNERKTTIPSYSVSPEDKISIREQSKKKYIFQDLDSKSGESQVPNWIKYDSGNKEAQIVSFPKKEGSAELAFDINAIIEFYKR